LSKQKLVINRASALSTERWVSARSAVSLLVLCLWSSSLRAQAVGDSVAIWTSGLQGGTSQARAAAVAGLARTPASTLPASTVSAVLGELSRVNQALLAGSDPGMPDTPDDHGEYYMSLVGIAVDLRTPDAARALVPAIAVSGAVQRRVARYGGDGVVAPLLDLITRRYSRDDALETLGLVWFWADSAGGPLSDASRSQIVEALTASALTGDDDDMRGVSAALREIKNPSFLALAQVLRGVAAAAGVVGDWSVQRLDQDVLPAMTAAGAARTNLALVDGTQRMLTAICSTSATGHRNGVCHSSSNDLTNAARHYSNGQFGPARTVFSTVANRFQSAKNDGTFSPAEYALLSSDLATLLARSW
jgi:hypothetical protein